MVTTIDQPGCDSLGARTCSADCPSGVAELAEGRLHNNPYRALQAVSCAYREGVLTLRGCLPTYYLKQIAQVAVIRIEGIARIDNQIEVR